MGQTPSPSAFGALNAEVVKRYRDGDYRGASEIAKRLLEAAREALDPKDPALFTYINNLGFLYQAQGRYGEAEPLFLEALEARRAVLGDRHPQTLGSINNLAGLYESQGRHGEAEPLFLEALEASRAVLGDRHPQTLTSINNLAGLYESQGRYGEAEPLYLEALEARRAVLGDRHPQTLTSINNLAGLYESQGRYGEAEPLYLEALEASRAVLGDRHPKTLTSINNLAGLYESQGRYGEAEPLYLEALEARRAVLGDRHPDTLTSINNLGFLYQAQGRYGDAEPLYLEALEARRAVLGDRHPQTLTSINNLAGLYESQGRHGEAEPLYLEALEARRAVLGDRHPQTLTSINNLAGLYESQGRHGEAEPLFLEALEASRAVLGEDHPNTLAFEMNLVALLVRMDRHEAALSRLERIGPRMLRWTGAQLTSTRQARIKRLVVNRRSSYQDVVLDLARLDGSPRSARLAAEVMLRWKGLAGEEEAYLAQLMRRAEDPRVIAVARLVRDLRGRLASAFHGEARTVPALVSELEASEARLSELSIGYRQQQEVLTAGRERVKHDLPEGSVLVEFRVYQPFDYANGGFGAHRLSAVLLSPYADVRFADLGPLSDVVALIGALNGDDRGASEVAARGLSERLFGPFMEALMGARRVYLAPDGPLHLVPFMRLPFGDQAHWVSVSGQDVRMVHSGRALVRPRGAAATKGLVAVGGVDFDDAGEDVIVTASLGSGSGDDDTRTFGAAGASLRAALSRFKGLPETGPEVTRISELYAASRPGEPITLWPGRKARERRLKSLATPPRVLHLATHGFYLPAGARVERPMLLSGLPLAGANKGLDGQVDPDGEDGVLYALEAMGLNLHGSELVALSACDTAKGSLDYSEGVYGLSRALRIAGADNVLITLWPLNDTRAREFMEAFYALWLRTQSDPAIALARVQRDWANGNDPARANPRAWAPYVLVQNGR